VRKRRNIKYGLNKAGNLIKKPVETTVEYLIKKPKATLQKKTDFYMKDFKALITILFVIGLILYILYDLFMAYRRNNIPQDKIVHTKAVIIDEENYFPNDKVELRHTYSYKFKVNGKTYKGDSNNMTVYLGDTIEVIYNKNNPNINRTIVHKLLPDVPDRYKNKH